jgi:hypothetical protein
MNDKIYPKGLRTFPPREGAPDFVKGTLLITINEFNDFIGDNQKLLTEYRGQDQLRCNILEGDKGLYFQVDTYKPDNAKGDQPQPSVNTDDDSEPLPF